MNSETKHTPGPWARIDTPDYAEIHPASGKAKSPIALVGRAEDADLIAAAPEMAEALRGLLAANDAVELVLCDSHEVPGYDPKELGRAQKRVTEAEKVARAALSKAGG